MENTKVSKNIVYLVDIIQKEINKQCCLPEGYNADLELEDNDKEPLGLKVIGITVTDKDGNEVYEGDKVQLVVEHGIATVYTAELHAAGRDSAALCHYNFKDTRLLTEATK